MKCKSTEKFFDEVSSFYDEMINFDNALQRRIELLKLHLTKEKHAADLGCGSGLDSIALTKLGLNVTAFDQSSDMIKTAKKNAFNYQSEIDLIVSSIENIPSVYNRKFGIVISLGNTLANLSPEQLKKAVKTFSNLLNPDGKVLIQILNFDKILKQQSFRINSFENERYLINRFYEYENDELLFKISVIEKETGQKKTISSKIYPHRSFEIVELFEKHQFKNIQLFGSLKKDKYDKDKSNDIVIIASI